jgi:allantoate deiminase
MSAALVEALSAAIGREGLPVRSLVSGAGHDAVIVGRDASAGMLFVRCLGGVSHSPLESVEVEDVATALRVLESAVRGRPESL